MASGSGDAKKRDLDDAYTNDYPRKRASPSDKQNMKEDNLAHEQLVSQGNGTLFVQPSDSNQQLYKVVVCKRKAQHRALRLCYRRKAHPRGRGCEMANKENELAAGNLHEKIQSDRHSFVLTSSDAGPSQTEGASSKYSSFFAEVSRDHETMTQVLFSRNLRLNVALMFWRKRSMSELIAYLVRMEDLGVIADCLPVITNSLQEDKTSLSIGCCVDLLPLVQSLLSSKFEEYIIVGLNWLQAIVKRWWTPFSANSESDPNAQILKQQLSTMWQQVSHLASVPGYTGNIAKDLDGYLSQLH